MSQNKLGKDLFMSIQLRYEDRLFTFEQGTQLLEILGTSVRLDEPTYGNPATSYTVVVHNEHSLLQHQVNQLLGITLETQADHSQTM